MSARHTPDLLEEHLADLRVRWSRAREGRQPSRTGTPATPLPALIGHWARVSPSRPALVTGRGTLTYRELDERVAALAGWLDSRGVRPGDRVAVLLPGGERFVVAMLAVLRLGAVHVPVNPMFRSAELRHELRDSGACMVVTDDALAPGVTRVRADTGVREVLADEEWPAALAHPPHPRVADDLDAPAALNYTGGTTGLPKGCVHTQRHMLYTAAAIAAGRGPKPVVEQMVALCYLPLFWIAGENLGILAPLVSGGTSVLLERWDARAVLRALVEHRVTTMAGTVENYLELLALLEGEPGPALPHPGLASFTAPLAVSFVRRLTPEVRARWRQAAGAHSVLREASYGMTETHTSNTNTLGFQQGDADLAPGSTYCGLPVPGTEVVVVDPATGRPRPLGESGEILLRGPSVMSGYWQAPKATAGALRGGWLHTGDTGRLDQDGALYYLGRSKDMIKVKGMSVFPSEVEALLGHHPEVLAAAVVAVEDSESGQRPYAFVRPRPGTRPTAASVEEWARGAMAPYKVPRVEVLPELPLTDTGKVRKTELVRRAQERATESA
ncbi:AMP-binding protein [Streptomyces sp. NPDC059740]|uniref:AMP-binding protein n=1 Tax=Streptomyces sp. NPDC059740 TaxID=3346926 RepID=UPI00365DEE24